MSKAAILSMLKGNLSLFLSLPTYLSAYLFIIPTMLKKL